MTGGAPPAFRRPLLCEKCLEALAVVKSSTRLSGLSVGAVIALWPETNDAVLLHEELCLPAGDVP